jgi:hypothetical protein
MRYAVVLLIALGSAVVDPGPAGAAGKSRAGRSKATASRTRARSKKTRTAGKHRRQQARAARRGSGRKASAAARGRSGRRKTARAASRRVGRKASASRSGRSSRKSSAVASRRSARRGSTAARQPSRRRVGPAFRASGRKASAATPRRSVRTPTRRAARTASAARRDRASRRRAADPRRSGRTSTLAGRRAPQRRRPHRPATTTPGSRYVPWLRRANGLYYPIDFNHQVSFGSPGKADGDYQKGPRPAPPFVTSTEAWAWTTMVPPRDPGVSVSVRVRVDKAQSWVDARVDDLQTTPDGDPDGLSPYERLRRHEQVHFDLTALQLRDYLNGGGWPDQAGLDAFYEADTKIGTDHARQQQWVDQINAVKRRPVTNSIDTLWTWARSLNGGSPRP